MSEVAKLAEVSPGLVSRVINEDQSLKIRQETRDRVLAAVEMLQYTPHASARALRSSQTGLLGFALHHVNDPIYEEMVTTAQTAAAERNYLIVMLNAAELMGRRKAFRELIRGHRVDGLLIQGGFADNGMALLELARTLPSLVFNTSPIPDTRTIRLDDGRAAAIATRHLIGLGHTRIAFVGAEGASSERRHSGYLAALAEHGLTPLPIISGGWDADSAKEETERYYASGGGATGLVVVTSTSALGVHSGVITSGRSIPDDISIVSIHDSWFAPHLNPPLTVVAMPLAQVGRLAVEILVEQLKSPDHGETILDDPPALLVERASTAPPPPACP